MTLSLEPGAWVHPDIAVPDGVRIGFCSCIGHGSIDNGPTTIEEQVQIGAFCVIEHGAHLGAHVLVDHYCRISKGVRIGAEPASSTGPRCSIMSRSAETASSPGNSLTGRSSRMR